MEIVSDCPLAVGGVLFRRAGGAWLLTIVTKATFRLAPGISQLVKDARDDLHETDGHWDDDEAKSLDVASDLAPFKRCADVIVVGHAHAADGVAVPSLVARVAIAGVDKSIVVRGDQIVDRSGRVSEAAPFVRMPLRWERAAGGPGTSNPAGIPTGAAARFDARGRSPLPNLLPEGAGSTSPNGAIEPAGLGPIAPRWPDRARWLATLTAPFDPDDWRAEPLPDDLDPAFFNAAPWDQQLAALDGSEVLHLEHLHARHARLSTRLATVRPRAVVEAGSARDIRLACDTLVVDTNRGVATLAYRGHVALEHPTRPGRVIVTAETPMETSGATPAAAQRAHGAREPVPERFADEEPVTKRGRPRAAPPAIDPQEDEEEGGAPQVLPFATAGEPRRDPLAQTGTVALPFRPVEGALVGKSALGRSMRLSAPTSTPPPPAPSAALPSSYLPPMSAPPLPVVSTLPLPASGAFPIPLAPALAGLPPMEIEDTATSDDALSGGATGAFVPPFLSAPAADTAAPAIAAAPPPWAHAPAAAPLPFAPPGAEIAPPPLAPLPFAPSSSAVAPTPFMALGAEASPPPFAAPDVGVAKVPVEAAQDAAPGEAVPAADVPPSDGAPPIEDYPIDRCARIAASIAMRPEERASTLEAQRLDSKTWARLEERWGKELFEEAKRCKSAQLKAYDAAYLAQIEAERGAITLAEYARLVVASERGDAANVERDLGLPAGVTVRVQRVWITKMARDVRLGKEARRAVEVERDR